MMVVQVILVIPEALVIQAITAAVDLVEAGGTQVTLEIPEALVTLVAEVLEEGVPAAV
jgi:hypothetical protein